MCEAPACWSKSTTNGMNTNLESLSSGGCKNNLKISFRNRHILSNHSISYATNYVTSKWQYLIDSHQLSYLNPKLFFCIRDNCIVVHWEKVHFFWKFKLYVPHRVLAPIPERRILKNHFGVESNKIVLNVRKFGKPDILAFLGSSFKGKVFILGCFFISFWCFCCQFTSFPLLFSAF